jgi:hypothetical protein
MLRCAGSFPHTEAKFCASPHFLYSVHSLIILSVVWSRFRTAQVLPLHPGQNTSVGLYCGLRINKYTLGGSRAQTEQGL